MMDNIQWMPPSKTFRITKKRAGCFVDAIRRNMISQGDIGGWEFWADGRREVSFQKNHKGEPIQIVCKRVYYNKFPTRYYLVKEQFRRVPLWDCSKLHEV